MATLRIAVVSYHNTQLTVADDAVTLGYLIDRYVETELKEGNLIQSINLEFSEEEGEQLRAQHAAPADYRTTATADDGAVYVKPRRR